MNLYLVWLVHSHKKFNIGNPQNHFKALYVTQVCETLCSVLKELNFLTNELWGTQIKMKEWTGNMHANIIHSYYYTA